MEALLVAAVDEERGPLPGVSVGVGPLRAALGAARALAARQPPAVVLVGTCGAYPGGPPIGAQFVAGALGFADLGAAGGLGYTPLPPPILHADAALSAVFRLPAASVLTLGAITSSATVAAALGASWSLEHLEAYAVAAACAEHGVPFAAVLGVTNAVGPDAHAEWRAHRAAVEAALVATVQASGLRLG